MDQNVSENILFIGFNQDSGKFKNEIPMKFSEPLFVFFLNFKSILVRMFHMWTGKWISNIQHGTIERNR